VWESGVSDTVDTVDRDQVNLNDVHHPVRADSKSVPTFPAGAPIALKGRFTSFLPWRGAHLRSEPDVVSDVSDPVDALDSDQVILNEVHHSERSGPQPVIVAAVEGFRRVRVLS
jgi:hypothetical protein